MYEEYKAQLVKINKKLQDVTTFNNKLDEKYEPLSKHISDLNYLRSNLELYIKWHDQAHQPGVYEGVDNLKACRVYE
jgi:hypothetical protein